MDTTKASPHRRIRFSLRTLFVAVTLVATILAWWTNSARRQRLAVAKLKASDPRGKIYYDYQFDNDEYDPRIKSAVPQMLLAAFGPDFFHSVREICVHDCAEDAAAALREIHTVKSVRLVRPSENAMRSLDELPNLESLQLVENFGIISGSLIVAPPWPATQTNRSGPNLKHLPTIPKLKVLYSEIVNSDWSAPRIAQCSRLERFSTRSDSYSNCALEQFAKLKRLKWLEIAGPGVNDLGLSSLLSLQDLEHLELTQANVTAEGLFVLQTLPNLKELVVSNRLKNDLPNLRATLPNCRVSAQ